jgi:FKBP-type peptidyl-prolyl cis-trans isomerase
VKLNSHSSVFNLPIAFCLLSFLYSSCGNEVAPKQKADPNQFKQSLEKVNKYEVEKESDEINQYIIHHDWQMQKTGTGLRYLFLAKGKGKQPQSGDFVKVNYKVSLLDGTECYSSDKDGAKEFKVEGEDIESGLHEAVLLMHIGDKAKFILPSYMAHGMHGDDEKIPPLSSIVVDLELLEVR